MTVHQANFTGGDLKQSPRERCVSSGRIGFAVTIFVLLCGPVRAGERLASTVLSLTEVALDGALWKLDEQKVDPDGSRRFFADYRDDDNIALSVTEEPLKTVAGEPTHIIQSATTRFLEVMKSKSQRFVRLDCPPDYRPEPGWVCSSYEFNLREDAPGKIVVMHLTLHKGALIFKRVKHPVSASEAQRVDARNAMNAVSIRP